MDRRRDGRRLRPNGPRARGSRAASPRRGRCLTPSLSAGLPSPHPVFLPSSLLPTGAFLALRPPPPALPRLAWRSLEARRDASRSPGGAPISVSAVARLPCPGDVPRFSHVLVRSLFVCRRATSLQLLLSPRCLPFIRLFVSSCIGSIRGRARML